MKKVIIKLICIISACVILTLFPLYSFATASDVSGDYDYNMYKVKGESYYEELRKSEDFVSPEEIIAGRYEECTLQKIGETQYSINSIPGLNVPFTTEKTIHVQKQINNYYCGPATVIQNLDYISEGRFNKTQSQVAAAIGTTTQGSSSVNMNKYMNEVIAANNYSPYRYKNVDISSPSFDETAYMIILYEKGELILHSLPPYGSFKLDSSISSVYSNGWPYSTSGGHFLTYSGASIYSKYNAVRFTDSYYQWKFSNASDSDCSYWVAAPVCMKTMKSFIYGV